MKSVLRFFVFIILFNLTVLLCLAVNFKLFFSSPENIKNLLKESNAYEQITAAVRDKIAEASQQNKENGALMEKLNEKISAADFQKVAEDFIDQYYAAIKKPKGERKIVIHYSLLQDKINPTVLGTNPQAESGQELTLPTDYSIDLDQQRGASFFTKINRNLIILIVLEILFIIFFLLLFGDSIGPKLAWFGSNLMVSAVIILGITLLFILIMPEVTDKLIKSSSIHDQKAIIGLQKAAAMFVKQQRLFYIIETGVLFVLSLVIIIVGKALGRSEFPEIKASNRKG